MCLRLRWALKVKTTHMQFLIALYLTKYKYKKKLENNHVNKRTRISEIWYNKHLWFRTRELNNLKTKHNVFDLFDWNFSSHSKISHSFGDVTIAHEGQQILTYARRLWPLSSEGSSACHTNYHDTGHPFMMVISEDPWHSHLLLSFSSGAVTTCFHDLGLSQLGFEHPTFRLRGQRFNPLRQGRGYVTLRILIIFIKIIIHLYS